MGESEAVSNEQTDRAAQADHEVTNGPSHGAQDLDVRGRK